MKRWQRTTAWLIALVRRARTGLCACWCRVLARPRAPLAQGRAAGPEWPGVRFELHSQPPPAGDDALARALARRDAGAAAIPVEREALARSLERVQREHEARFQDGRSLGPLFEAAARGATVTAHIVQAGATEREHWLLVSRDAASWELDQGRRGNHAISRCRCPEPTCRGPGCDCR